MINILGKNLFRFFFLILIQVLIFNKIELTSIGISPHLYVMFILLLPFETPAWLLLCLAAGLGFSVDLFSDTFGLHGASCVLMAFARPFVLELSAPRDGYESGSSPEIEYFGFVWFTRYCVILVLLHHILYFFLDAFGFENLYLTIGKILITTLISTFLIILSQYITWNKRQEQ